MMMNQLKKYGPRLGAAVAAIAIPGLSHAQAASTTFDPSSYVTQITATIAGLLLVGGAVFAVHVALKSTKWARKAL